MATVLADLSLRLSANVAELQKGLDAAKAKLAGFKGQMQGVGKEISAGFKSASASVSQSLNMMTGGMYGFLEAGLKTFKGLITGVKGFASAFAATGIGAIILGITAALAGLVAAFKRTGEGEDKLAVITGYLKGAFEAVIKVLVKVGEWLIKAFEDPQAAIKELWELIKQNLVNRFQGIVKLFTAGWEVIKNGAMGVGLAIKGIFDEESRKKSQDYFKQMTEGLKDVAGAAIQIATGVTPETFKELGAEIKKNAELGAAWAEQEDALDERKRNWLVEQASLEEILQEARLAAAEEDAQSLESRQKKLDLINVALAAQKQINAGNISIAEAELALLKNKQEITGITNDETMRGIKEAEAAVKNASAEGTKALVKLQKQATTLGERIESDLKEIKIPALKPIAAPQLETGFNKEKENIMILDQMYKALAKHKIQYEKEAALAAEQFQTEQKERLMVNTMFALELAQQGLTALSDFQEAAMNKELEAAGNNEAKKDAIKKKYAQKQKSTAIGQAIIAGALAIVQGFAQLGPIGGAIAAVLTAATTVAQIAKIKSTPLAKGGIAYGETLATVGEYTGAKSNPEVIAPLDKLKSLLEINKGGMNWDGEVEFVIDGYQLKGLLTKTDKKLATY